MIEFKSLTLSATWKILFEIINTLNNNPEVFEYIKSGKADYFGFDDNEELLEDRLLFRPYKDTEFTTLTDYLIVEEEPHRIKLAQYVLLKLRTTFQDLEDEKVLEEVKKFISTFNNNEKKNININLEISENHSVLGNFLAYLNSLIYNLRHRENRSHDEFFDVDYWETQSNLEILSQLKNQVKKSYEKYN